MSYQFLCEVFILVVLGVSCARVFFIQPAKMDYLSVLPILSFFASVLSLLAFGVSIFGLLIMLLAFFVMLWNSNALSRLNHKLVVDSYGLFFTISSIINLVLVIVLLIFVILLRPAKIDLKKYGVEISSKTYAGKIDTGFTDYTSPAQKRSVFIKKYISKDKSSNPFNESRVIVFIPGELATSDVYEPFFVKLARDGYTVYSAEFYTKELPWFKNLWDFKPLRRFAMAFAKNKKLDAYEAATQQKTENFAQEIMIALDIVAPSKSDKVFIVGDGENLESFNKARSVKGDLIKGSFDLSTIPSYPTAGYGPVESTDPLVGNYLGRKRDGTFYLSSHVAGILEKSIDELLYPKAEKAQEVEETNQSEEESTLAESSTGASE